ncbi:MAG: carboxypeptidase-like regulatory domain-containing protein, partial [Saprospiraceae bacterium]
MKIKQLIFCLAALFLAGTAFAQEGIIRGTINDLSNGEPLMFTNVVVPNTSPVIGAQTDLDGNYELNLAAGTYVLEVSYVGYATKTITDIEVKAGEITVVDFPMEEAGLQLEEVVVKASRIDRSENALLMLQKKSYAIQDGISSQ